MVDPNVDGTVAAVDPNIEVVVGLLEPNMDGAETAVVGAPNVEAAAVGAVLFPNILVPNKPGT